MGSQKIAIIGGGNLGTAIAHGLIKKELYQPQDITVTRRKPELLNELKDKGVNTHSDNIKAVEESNIVVLAVKPFNVINILDELEHVLTAEKILISVATGVTIAEMQSVASSSLPIFRAMPNTAIAINESMTCVCATNASQDQEKQITAIFETMGEVAIVTEELMEASTVLAACGIAYVMRFIRAMVQGGIEIGFDSKTASLIANQTVKGAAELLLVNGQHPEHEIDKVTTPKGCTIAGLNEMEHQGFSSSLIKGIKTSYQKIEK